MNEINDVAIESQEEGNFDRSPYQRHSPTSHEAARMLAPKLQPMELEIMNLIADSQAAAGTGMTDDELIADFGSQSARPRRIFLVKIGKLKDSGAVRKTRSGRNAVVWVLA
jgi:hypothetical protein